MSENVAGAENQQATSDRYRRESSETTRQTPFTKSEIIPVKNHRLFAKIIGSWHPVKSRIFSERMKI